MLATSSPPITAARRAFSLTSLSQRVILSTGSARCRASTDRRMTGLDRRHRADVRSMAPEARTARPGTRGMRHRGRALWSRRMCGGLVTGGLPGQLPPLRRRQIAATGLPSAARGGAAPGCDRYAPGCRVVFCVPEVDGDEVPPAVDDEAAGITGLGRLKPLCRRQRLLGAGDRRGVVGVLPDDCVHQFLLVLFRLVSTRRTKSATWRQR